MSQAAPFLVIALSMLAIAVSLYSLVISAVAHWYVTTAATWRTEPLLAQRRTHSKPWYVRHFEWIEGVMSPERGVRHERDSRG